MNYGFLADVLVVIHALYVGFVVFGQLAIVIGLLCRWGWARNFWFRSIHLLAILIVAGEAAADVPCPLTTLENEWRERAGQPVEQATFMGQLAHNVLFYDVPQSYFPPCHMAFGGLVLATFVLGPPHLPVWLRRRRAMQA